ncbi:MAG: hypothetical protein HQL51_05520 [Magnetococcales bacterium]|nr:hypothetical protein [Magnetococcales bacterium]
MKGKTERERILPGAVADLPSIRAVRVVKAPSHKEEKKEERKEEKKSFFFLLARHNDRGGFASPVFYVRNSPPRADLISCVRDGVFLFPDPGGGPWGDGQTAWAEALKVLHRTGFPKDVLFSRGSLSP